jgi:hypothetical protein
VGVAVSGIDVADGVGMTVKNSSEIGSCLLETDTASLEVDAKRVVTHDPQYAPYQCSVNSDQRTLSADCSEMRDTVRMRGVAGASELDDAVRIWLAPIVEEMGKSQVSRWMGYQRSRTQLDGYMARKGNLAFRVEWIASIAAGLGISTDEALSQIRDVLRDMKRAAAASPLPGRAERLAKQSALPPEAPVAKTKK